jgi:hypothetical protein
MGHRPCDVSHQSPAPAQPLSKQPQDAVAAPPASGAVGRCTTPQASPTARTSRNRPVGPRLAVKERRQLIITTHDARFGSLLERKLRALNGQRTVRIDLEGWSRHGPTVSQRDVPAEQQPLRLVAV